MSFERSFETPIIFDGMFAGPEFVTPSALNPVVTQPFTFTGRIRVFSDQMPLDPRFDFELYGQGIMTARFITVADGRAQQLLDVTYQFTPVPEPATLVLLGTGLAGVAAAARRRRRRRN